MNLSVNNQNISNSVPVSKENPATTNSDVRKDIELSLIHTVEAKRLAELRGVHISVKDEQKIKTIDRALKAMGGPDTTLEFSIHEQTNNVMIKVKNQDTGELIREIPPEKTLDAISKLMEVAGILIDEKV